MKKMGWVRSSGDLGVPAFKNSNTLKALAANNTSDTYIIKNNIGVFDQKTLSSCIANATCAAFSILKNIQDGSIIEYSRLFVYWNLRAASQSTNKDAGGYIHDAFSSLKTIGICRESSFPYDVNMVFSQPSILSYKEGNDNQIDSFFQIQSEGKDRVADVEAAIRANHPVVLGTQISLELETYNGNVDSAFDTPSSTVGGHALCVVGVRNNGGQKEFCVLNSWGDTWGIGGFFWMSEEYLTWSETADIFVATATPNLLV